MDRTEFYRINTINGDNFLSDNYCESLYDYFVFGGKVYNYSINITFDEFNRIFSVIVEGVGSKLSQLELKKAILQYIQLIMCDAREGKFVDIYFFVKCLDYLGLDILDNKFLKKIRKNVKVIKKSLMNEYSSLKKSKK